MTRNEVLSVLGFAECSIEHKHGPGLMSVMHINYRYNPKVPEEMFEEHRWAKPLQDKLTRAYNLLNVVGDVPLSVMGYIVFGGLNKPDMQYDVKWSQEWDQKRYAPLIDAVKEILDEVFVSLYGMCLVWPK